MMFFVQVEGDSYTFNAHNVEHERKNLKLTFEEHHFDAFTQAF